MKKILFAVLAVLIAFAFGGDPVQGNMTTPYIGPGATADLSSPPAKGPLECRLTKAIYGVTNASPQDVDSSGYIKLASTCTDACKWNYDQCMKGCAGATSCSEQCQRNYDGSMDGCR